MLFTISLKTRLCLCHLLTIALSILIVPSALATQFYLEDADRTNPPAPSASTPTITQHKWPRVIMAETQSMGGELLRYAKYQMIASSAGSIERVATLQQSFPDLMYMRQITPAFYLGYNNETASRQCVQTHGNSFSRTTASTGNCGVYAGHWLYEAGTRSTNALTASSTSLRVQDASRFTNGEYIVIYNAPAGSFNNAEHAEIIGKNNATNTLTLRRAFKSNGVPHASNSIVAQHSRGDTPLNWAYNMSTQSPRDANNRRYNQFLPGWINQNISRNLTGEPTTANVSGILFDVDHAFVREQSNADVNNDLITDDGISSSGVNWWGQGFNQFYASVRGFFPNLIISGGVNNAGGFNDINGVQMEGFPNIRNFRNPNPDYENIASQLSRYSYNLKRRGIGPAHSHVLSKTPSRLYPVNTSTRPSSNKNFRFVLGLTLLEDGFFGFENSNAHQDLWYDEYAVDVTRGSPTYGRAINFQTNSVAEVRANRGWLGRPSGPRRRLYSDTEFAQQNAIFSAPFNVNLTGWEGRQTNISLTNNPADVRDGAGALQISGHVGGYQREFFEASARGPAVTVTQGQDYTFVFSTKATRHRQIAVTVGGHAERFTIGPEWQRHVMTFTAKNTLTARPSFNVGRENTQVWIDTVHLFEGDANVFRRDFERGIVVVNATPKSRTVSLQGTFRRIQGTQDSVNNGATLSNLTLPPYDSALLVRLENQQPNSDAQPPAIVINAPTKTRVGPITDTTIVVTDALSLDASDIALGSGNTAGVSNLNCTQINNRRASCTLTITASGNLSVIADDLAGNRAFATETNYRINGGTTGDGVKPHININAPTRTKIGPITNTTISVTDNVQIRARDIELRSATSAGVRDFNCVQVNGRLVECTLRIISSGDLRLKATDVAGNEHFAGQNGYRINAGPPDTTKPFFVITAPTKVAKRSIRDTIIEARDLVSINASSVRLRADNTVKTKNLNCSQIDSRKVRCSIIILSSGTLKLQANDTAGNSTFKNEAGYQITGDMNTVVTPIIMLLLE